MAYWDGELFKSKVIPYLWDSRALAVSAVTGKLGCSLEGAGKRRIFAIGNYVNQRLLRPVHEWCAEVLRRLSCDGTFDQTRPLKRLVGKMECFSFDLSSATDRWPLVVQFEVFQYLFGLSFSSAVVNSTLATNIFDVPFVKQRSEVAFVAGQPLG